MPRYRFDAPNLTGHAFPQGLSILKRAPHPERDVTDQALAGERGLLWPGDEVESIEPIDSPIWTPLDDAAKEAAAARAAEREAAEPAESEPQPPADQPPPPPKLTGPVPTPAFPAEPKE